MATIIGCRSVLIKHIEPKTCKKKGALKGKYDLLNIFNVLLMKSQMTYSHLLYIAIFCLNQ